MVAPILTHFQVRPLIARWVGVAEHIVTSLDMGLSEVRLLLDSEGLHLPQSGPVSWENLHLIAANENACFQLGQPDTPHKLVFYSDFTERAYSLYPTNTAPTLLVSGITMHRIVDCDPWQDTINKIEAVGRPLTGKVLDTCMGLGYTAIQAAKKADEVITCELDPVVERVCRTNPWSAPLFSTPSIKRHLGHVWDVVEPFEAGSFSTIIHDPPMFNMAGELYSGEFYTELYRLLGHRGRLFHYIGNPESRSGGGVTRGVIRRLQESGFQRVIKRPRAFGVLAIK